MTIKQDQHGLTVQAARPAFAWNVPVGAGSLQSAPFQSGNPMNTYNPDGTVSMTTANNTTHIRLVSNTACWVAFGTNPIAIAAGALSIYLPAYTPEYFYVNRGERIAVIQDVSNGNLNIAELSN
jgi:hypothetical protein